LKAEEAQRDLREVLLADDTIRPARTIRMKSSRWAALDYVTTAINAKEISWKAHPSEVKAVGRWIGFSLNSALSIVPICKP
jgi:hypothetical protein